MVRTPHGAVLLALFASSLNGCASLRPRPSLEEARDGVRAAMTAGTRALERHDWEAYTQFWANDPDIEVIHPAAREWITGWDSTAFRYRRLIADTTVGYRATTVRQHIHVSEGRDMAWVTQADSIAITTARGVQTATQWSTSVFERRRGQWRLVHAHASVPPAPPRSAPR